MATFSIGSISATDVIYCAVLGVETTLIFFGIDTPVAIGPTNYQVTSGELPPGMSLVNNIFPEMLGSDPFSTSRTLMVWALKGTPTQSGLFNFHIYATDTHGNTGDSDNSVLVNPVQTGGMSLPMANPGSSYSFQLSDDFGAFASTPPYVYGPLTEPGFSVEDSLAFTGFSLSSTGLISSTKVRNSAGISGFVNDMPNFTLNDISEVFHPIFHIPVACHEPIILNTPPFARVGEFYYFQFNITIVPPPFTFSFPFPFQSPTYFGLSVDLATGEISGIATDAGTITTRVFVSDSLGGTSFKDFTFLVKEECSCGEEDLDYLKGYLQ